MLPRRAGRDAARAGRWRARKTRASRSASSSACLGEEAREAPSGRTAARKSRPAQGRSPAGRAVPPKKRCAGSRGGGRRARAAARATTSSPPARRSPPGRWKRRFPALTGRGTRAAAGRTTAPARPGRAAASPRARGESRRRRRRASRRAAERSRSGSRARSRTCLRRLPSQSLAELLGLPRRAPCASPSASSWRSARPPPGRRRSAPRRGSGAAARRRTGADPGEQLGAGSEWPPRSKKLSSTPTSATPSTSAQRPASSCCSGVEGGTRSAAGAGLGRRQGLAVDLAVGGERQRSSATKGAGTMYSGSALGAGAARSAAGRIAAAGSRPRGRPTSAASPGRSSRATTTACRTAGLRGRAPPRSRPARCGSRAP